MVNAGFGIYIHWPFCQAKCPYCDFNSHVVATIDHDRWSDAYLRELDRVAAETSEKIVRSVFFGGGTPSLMPAKTVDLILERISRNWRFENDVEITLEANPTSVESERFQGYRAAGVNRVSLGVQAMNDPDLKRLGRLHSAKEALNALELARSVFDRFSFDLIYARQDQSVPDWEEELLRALSFEPSHLSLYQLTIEEGTAFGDRFAAGRLRGLPDEDLGADLWETTQRLCNEAGLPAYEVSNHAKAGYESKHNLIYWTGGDYAGIGPGAHGRLTNDRGRIATESVKAPTIWLNSVSSDLLAHESRSVLSRNEIWEERLMMGLRIAEGVLLSKRQKSELYNQVRNLIDLGVVSLEGDTLQVTPSGFPVLNSILRMLLSN